MLKPSLFLLSLASIWTYRHHAAAVTIYGQEGVTAVSGAATGTGAAAAATATDWLSALAAFNNVTLTAPALPTSMPSTAFTIPVMNNAQDVQGLSIQQGADFFGFSIEMSVVTQVIGKNASFIQVPFLNLLATVADRAGRVRIRVGGNTQETATLVDSLPDNEMIAKDKTDATNPVRCSSVREDRCGSAGMCWAILAAACVHAVAALLRVACFHGSYVLKLYCGPFHDWGRRFPWFMRNPGLHHDHKIWQPYGCNSGCSRP
ncbi:hypothetical protein BD310DRAFT_357271 [Dichomitus squalens]|uniref:Uncharacterized protein n=1 Tax=Dichomitus squalens TaxID=114155 RepID=A0A4Q9PZ95_9APHY|nr:hypothetical protein BD310DRAFT_357271 [Dichomitus squalens]